MTGSNILDTLNSKSISGGMNTTYARFRLQDIPIDKIYSNDKNFYPLTDIEQLANEIKLCGLMENLTVVKDSCERGEYRLVSGERRWRALTYLVEHGESKFKNVSAKITKFDNQNEEELYLIVANSYRTKDSSTKMNEVKRMQELLQNAKENGTSINGYDMQQESIRSVMSKLLGMSETKIAELTVVINHLIDEFMTMLNDGTLGISVAYKIAGMSPDMQLEFFDYCENEPKITLNVVQQFKEKKTAEHEQEQIPGQSSIDLADLKVKSIDVEAWSPRQKKYFEVGSCSNLGDAQARRLQIRVRGENGEKYFAHTLNNTVVAPPRMLIAFLENNLQADGNVRIPEALRPYMGGKEFLGK